LRQTLFLNDYGRCDITTGCDKMDEIIDEAGELLSNMPIDATVFVTSSDLDLLTDMMYELSDYEIDDLTMVTPQEILNGRLRGRIGVLLQKDMRFLSDIERELIDLEAHILQLGPSWYGVYAAKDPEEAR